MHLRNHGMDELGLCQLSPEVKQYIAELELEVDRLQRRSKAHRQNIRSMQSKLVGVNLRRELACLAQPVTNVTNITQPVAEDDVKRIVKDIAYSGARAARAAV